MAKETDGINFESWFGAASPTQTISNALEANIVLIETPIETTLVVTASNSAAVPSVAIAHLRKPLVVSRK